jgi:hypothetical protein
MNSNPGNLEAKAFAGQSAGVAQGTSFQKLQKRAFGGEDVAARPGAEDDEWWPMGPLLPGVRELIADFIADIESPEDLHIVFLLGGAGNGKSFAARSLGKELGLSASASDALAHRLYKTIRNGVSIELLNDATIAPSADYQSLQAVALACDIQRWWDESAASAVAAFCCVNRGIVIDELRSLSEHGHSIEALSHAVLAWLACPERDIAGLLDASRKEPKLVLGDHYHELRFDLGGRAVRISAMSVDACSLMDIDGAQSRAGTLFQQIMERCRDDAMARPVDCPIRANVQQWLPPNTILGWENILAHAEIASGRLHSYRDVWGLAALSILGPRFATSDGSRSLLDHVDRFLYKARSESSLKKKLDALLELSHFRMHNALFRAPMPTGDDAMPFYPPTTPAHLGLSLVDPSTWGSMDSQAVEAAMQSIALGGMPSESLFGRGLLDNAWFGFDKCLEQAIVEYVGSNDCSDIVRRRLVSWFGGYLTRLVGVSTGHLGNRVVVAQWKLCREKCAKGVGKLPLEFEKAIRSLIFPQHDDAPRDCILVPAFAARVEPLQASREGASPRLTEIIPHNSINLQVRQQGSRLVLECTLMGHAEVIGQFVLDFPLIREALACRGHRAGQTESTAHVEPRIERCRASSLSAVPANQRRLVVISGGSPVELS